RSYGPYFAVVVAAELALRIGSVEVWGKQAGRPERPDEFFVIIAEDGVELLHRPGHIYWTQLHIVSGMQFSVVTLLVRHYFELLIALRVCVAAETRDGRLGQGLDVIDLVVDDERTLQNRTAEHHIALARDGVRGHVDFRDDLGCRMRDDRLHLHARAEI